MKKIIALVISASVIAAPVAFAADEATATTDASAQQMTADQAAPAKKATHPRHCAKHNRHHHKANTAKPAPVAPAEDSANAPAAQ